MKIEISKRTDGSVVLKLDRRDGTSDWQKQQGPRAELFAAWQELPAGRTLELTFPDPQ